MPPQLNSILESALYVTDVPRSIHFYESIFGFCKIKDFGARGSAMQVASQQVLLLFRQGASLTIQSPHDGCGELHIAFSISASELSTWESWLAANNIPIEEKHTWEHGGISLYFRDPDRHLLELATPGVWSIY